MAALIKNALVKQISKFLKNVTPNQINISTLKGEGEMKNIQLDENVLMDLLEFPTWLRISNARCNKASVKIQWTKLKTNPIIIFLDKIEIDVEIADPLREYSTSNASKMFDKDSTGAYGFIDKCIDAIQLNIDSVTITIKSKTFNATLNMSNICVYSVTPNWKVTNDIRNTRLKDLEKEEIILFKEISWEICRLEAFTIETGSQNQSATSIKLIMNPSKLQIVLKKRLSDKSLINSTIRILLNEIYWMASDTQLKAAIGTYKTLSKLMTKSFNQKKKFIHIQQQQQATQNRQNQTKNATSSVSSNEILSKVFLQYDIKETSLHLQISNLNIHLYADDNYSGNKYIDGGSMQFLFKNVCIDHYPYHKVGSTTKHWNNYNHIFRQREDWSKNLSNEFVSKLEEILSKSSIKDLSQIRLKNNINLLESCTIFSLKDFCIYKVTTNLSNKQANSSSMKAKKANQETTSQPSTTYNSINDFLKMKDYFIDQQMYNMRPFLSSNSAEFNLPSDTLFANCFFSDFYFPEDINYPVPSPQVFVQVSPVLLNIDFLTLLWINTLAFSLWREKLIVDQNDKPEKFDDSSNVKSTQHCDTYLEVILPKVSLSIYPTKNNPNTVFENQTFQERPNSLEIGIAKLVVTNQTLTKSNRNFSNFESASQKSYSLASNLIEKNTNFKSNVKKLNAEYDVKINNLAPCFNEILKNENVSFQRFDLSSDIDLINTTTEAVNSKLGLFLKSLNKNALNKNGSKDMWTIDIESLWIDMIDKESLPFVQNLSFKIYIVNVWDFLSRSFMHTEVDVEEKSLSNSSKVGFKEAYKRLEQIIKIQNPDVPNEDKFRKRSNSLSTTTRLVHSQTKSEFICKKIYSTLNIITEIKNINVFINHSQILFLLRLVDVIDNFTKQVEIDTEQTLKFKGNSNKDVLIEKDDKLKIKSLKLEDLFEEDLEVKSDEASVNLALIVNNLEVDLSINDMRKDIKFEPNVKIDEEEDQNSTKVLYESTKAEEKNVEKSEENSNYKEEFDIIVKQLDKEIITGYVKYVYGLSNENPNTGLVFHSVPSTKDVGVKELNASIDSGFASSEKSSLSSSFSTKTLSAGITKLASKIAEPSESDLFVDDNDNMSVILSLAQDDTSSLVSTDAQILLENAKNSPSRSMSSASDAGSISASSSQLNKQMDLDQVRSFSINSNISRTISTNNQNVQTGSAKSKIKLKIKNLNVYVQTIEEKLTALITLQTLQIRDRKSSSFDQDKPNELLVRFIKNPSDTETVNGLAEIYLHNYRLDLDVPTLVGIVDMVDDDDDFCKEIKESLALSAYVKNCAIKLNDDPFNSYEQNPKLLDLFVEYLVVNKTPNNRLIINEIRLGNDLDSEKIRLQLNKKIQHEFKFVQESKSDMSCVQFTSKSNFKIGSDKFASLVLMLRKEKEENHALKNKIDKQRHEFKSKEEHFKSKIDLVENENQQLKLEIERLKNLCEQKKSNEVQEPNGFLLTDKTEETNLSEKLEMERKQFESLLLGYQEENELLKSKLRKTEDYVSLLNIERECLMKKINQSKI